MDPRQAGRPASNLQGAARKRWWRVTLADVPPNPYPSSLPCSSICSKPPTSPRLPPSFSKFLPREKCGPYQQLNLCRLSELPEFLSLEIRCFQAAIVKGAKSQVRNMSFSIQNNSMGEFLPCDISEHWVHTEKGNFEQNLCRRKKRDVRITRSAYSTLV